MCFYDFNGNLGSCDCEESSCGCLTIKPKPKPKPTTPAKRKPCEGYKLPKVIKKQGVGGYSSF